MKPNNTNIAKFYNLDRRTIGTYKKEKKKIYEALKTYFMKGFNMSREDLEALEEHIKQIDEYIDSEVHSRCEYDIYTSLKDFLEPIERHIDESLANCEKEDLSK